MSAQRSVHADAASAARACAGYIAASRPATLVLSGGGTARQLFQALLAIGFPDYPVHLFWADERGVPPSDPASNYGVAEALFIRPAGIPPLQVHRIRGELAPDLAAVQYAQEIRDFFGLREGELPRFDLVHLGMGGDAHTASLFPGDPLIHDRTGIAAAARTRVTLLPGAILSAKHIAVLAAGPDKRDAARAAFEGDYDPVKYPAQIPARADNAIWFLDEPAAP